MNHEDLQSLAAHVTPQNARSYALANGWRRVPNVNGEIALFDRDDSSLDQLIIPLSPSAPDYSRRIVDVVSNLSEIEQRAPAEILGDLLQPDADVVRYSIASPQTMNDDLPLDKAIGILEGARRSLLASACSVISPSKHHPRMSLTDANQLLEVCRLKQTERGSYTIVIACPLRAVASDNLLFEDQEPFTRQTTEWLMQSVNRLAKAMTSDDISSIYEKHPDQPVISANLCDALLRMQPADEKSTLTISVTWASTLPQKNSEQIPNSVRFQFDDFPILETVYQKLLAVPQPTSSFFIGYVDTLNGDVGDDGRVQGDTRFLIVHEEEIVKARADLSADDYQRAIQAHAQNHAVTFKGVLHPQRRTHRITNVQDLAILSNT